MLVVKLLEIIIIKEFTEFEKKNGSGYSGRI